MTTEREIQLSAVFGIILRRGARILMFAAACAVIAGLISLTIANRYESEVRLLMNKSKIGERTMQNPALPMDSFHEIFFPPNVLQEIMDEFELHAPPTRFKHFKDFEKRIRLAIRERGATFVLRVMLEDPQLAADVANALALKAVELNESLIEQEMRRSFSLINSEFMQAKERTDAYYDAFLKMQLENNKDTLMHRLNTHNTILATLRQMQVDSEAALIQLREREKQFGVIFSATDFKPTIDVRRSVLSDNLAMLMTRDLIDEADVESILDLQFIEQTPNQAYVTLQQEYQKLLVDLPAEEENFKWITIQIERLDKEVIELENELHRKEMEEMIAKANFDRSLEIMGGVEKELWWTGSTISSERQDIDILGYAIPDERKVFPRRSLIILMAGLIAFLLAFLFYLLTDLYGLVTTGVAAIAPELEGDSAAKS